MTQNLLMTLMFTIAVAFAFEQTRWLGVIGVALLAWIKPEIVPYLALLGLLIGGAYTYLSLRYGGRRRRR